MNRLVSRLQRLMAAKSSRIGDYDFYERERGCERAISRQHLRGSSPMLAKEQRFIDVSGHMGQAAQCRAVLKLGQ